MRPFLLSPGIAIACNRSYFSCIPSELVRVRRLCVYLLLQSCLCQYVKDRLNLMFSVEKYGFGPLTPLCLDSPMRSGSDRERCKNGELPFAFHFASYIL